MSSRACRGIPGVLRIPYGIPRSARNDKVILHFKLSFYIFNFKLVSCQERKKK